jgi:hypothetical protein
MGGIAWPRLGGYKAEATRACPAAPGSLPGLNRALRVPSTARHGPALLLPDDGGNVGRVDAVEVKLQPAG